jgi:hypothetical protein
MEKLRTHWRNLSEITCWEFFLQTFVDHVQIGLKSAKIKDTLHENIHTYTNTYIHTYIYKFRWPIFITETQCPLWGTKLVQVHRRRHAPPSSAEVKERVELYLYFPPPRAFLACARVNFTSTFCTVDDFLVIIKREGVTCVAQPEAKERADYLNIWKLNLLLRSGEIIVSGVLGSE